MNSSSLLRKFQSIDDNLNAAFELNDIEKIRPLLSRDWFLLDPKFGITSAEKFLAQIESGNLLHISMKKTVQKLVLENDIAIVISKGINRGRYKGIEFNAEHWVTQTYGLNDSRWLCIMTQEMPVSC